MWGLVILNVAIFLIFAFSFTHPKTKRDWRSFGAFSAFIVALFTEMYGFPLTIYFLSGWLTKWVPGLDPFSHNSGHILEDLFGWGGDPHFGPFHIASYILIFYGFSLLAKSWKVLYASQRDHTLAATLKIRVITGRNNHKCKFLEDNEIVIPKEKKEVNANLNDIFEFSKVELEEREMQKEFGDVYKKYYEQVPAFIPRLKK